MHLDKRVVDNFGAFCLAFVIRQFDWQANDFGAALERQHGRFV